MKKICENCMAYVSFPEHLRPFSGKSGTCHLNGPTLLVKADYRAEWPHVDRDEFCLCFTPACGEYNYERYDAIRKMSHEDREEIFKFAMQCSREILFGLATK